MESHSFKIFKLDIEIDELVTQSFEFVSPLSNKIMGLVQDQTINRDGTQSMHLASIGHQYYMDLGLV